MGLVEQAAAYLDGEGRQHAGALSPVSSGLFTAESMRLTTRLMQIASWLLLQRAAHSGEMSRAQVAAEKVKVRLDTPSAPHDSEGWDELPERFVQLIVHSLNLQGLVRRMDEEIYGNPAAAGEVTAPNPVSEQINLLRTAFSYS